MKKSYVVYILRCGDGSLYTGITHDLEARLKKHREGKGAKYVRSHLPVKLVRTEKLGAKGAALRREAEIKRLSKAEKEMLVSRAPNKRRGAAIKPKLWYQDGVRFKCQGSGNCCLSRGEYGYVYLTLADRQRLAAHLKLTTRKFTDSYCGKKDGYFFLSPAAEDLSSPMDEEACRFFSKKRCTVYEARPTQCRTWPFWPENMDAKTWNTEIARECPGVGRGPLVPYSEIRANLRRSG